MHAGIEIKLTLDGDPVVIGDSDFLHYCAKYAGIPLGEWMQVAGWDTCHGAIRLELRALELSSWDEDLAALEHADAERAAAWPGSPDEVAAAQAAAAAAELELLEARNSADHARLLDVDQDRPHWSSGRCWCQLFHRDTPVALDLIAPPYRRAGDEIAELADAYADQAAASPCGGCPSITGCRQLGGCQLGPLLSEAAAVAGYAAAPGPLLGRDTGAARPGAGPDGLTELAGEPTRGAPRQARRRLGTGIARIAMRARFRSGR